MHRSTPARLRLNEAGPLTAARPAELALTERGRVVEAGTTAAPHRKMIQIITPGWGSSGYYSADVLEKAATDKVIPAGTHMYLNHASETEAQDRPERDIEKIAAVLVEDATWDGTRLTAPADLMGPHAELIESLAPYIGVSISGSATDIVIGEAEGRRGPIIEGLAHVASVDFVTHAGRGGMVLLEGARPSLVNARAAEHGVAEATVNDTREQLQSLLRDTYGGEKTYLWVRDFDATTVWFEVEDAESSGIYAQTYTQSDTGAVALTGDWTEVRVQTTYVPVDQTQNVTATRPGSNTTTQESKEDTMPQIEEARLRQLEADAGRVQTLESELSTEKARGDKAERELADRTRTDRATEVLKDSAHVFTALEARGLLTALPVTDEGALDEAAFTKRLDEAAPLSAHVTGTKTGLVGLGESAQPEQSTDVTESTPTTSPWGRPLTSVKGA